MLRGYAATMAVGSRRRGGSILGVLVVVWLVIGVIAAAQRGYFSGGDASCAGITTIVVTIVAGPLNYVGLNPKVKCAGIDTPEPSK